MSADASATGGLTPAPAGSIVPSTSNYGAPAGSGTVPSGTTSTPGSNTNPSSGNDIIITKRIMSDSSWPANLQLDLAKSNWEEWSFQLRIQTDRLGFT